MKKIIHSIGMAFGYFFIPLLMMNGLLYIAGAFIAQDADPKNWFLFAVPEGRIVFVGMQFLFFFLRNDFWRKFK